MLSKFPWIWPIQVILYKRSDKLKGYSTLADIYKYHEIRNLDFKNPGSTL